MLLTAALAAQLMTHFEHKGLSELRRARESVDSCRKDLDRSIPIRRTPAGFLASSRVLELTFAARIPRFASQRSAWSAAQFVVALTGRDVNPPDPLRVTITADGTLHGEAREAPLDR